MSTDVDYYDVQRIAEDKAQEARREAERQADRWIDELRYSLNDLKDGLIEMGMRIDTLQARIDYLEGQR